MTHQQAKAEVLEALREIAPESAEVSLDEDRPIRDQIELDSIDALRFLGTLAQEAGVEIPASAFGELDTIARCAAYVEHAAEAPPASP